MTAAPRPRQTAHFLTMDGLRGVAALAVLIFHQGSALGAGHFHGYLAVDFFFLLSGFVIAHAYGERLAERRMTRSKFIWIRAVRLYPLIVFGAILGTAAMIVHGAVLNTPGATSAALKALPLAALALPQPFTESPFQPNGPVWSLFFEIIANLVYVLAISLLRTRVLLVVASVCAVGLVLVARAHSGVHIGMDFKTMPLGLLRVGYPFALGIIFQRLHAAGRLKVPGLPIWILAPALLAVLATPFIAWYRGEVLFTLAAIFIAFPLIVASASNDAPTPNWGRLSKFSSTLSYPIYIVHVPIILLLSCIPAIAALPITARYVVALAVCVPAALIIGKQYDKRVRGWLTRQKKA